VAEAVALLAEFGDEAKVLAGGQSLVPMLNLRLARPGHLIDIARIPSLRGVQEDGDGLRIGAVTTQRDIERSELVARKYPLLSEAIRHIAHPPIRVRGTVGGSLSHADPAAELPAVAVLLDAELTVVSKRGQRVIPAQDFFVSFLTSALAPDEMLTEIRLPAWPSDATWAFSEVSRRHGDFALAGVAAIVERDNSTVTGARIALFGVGATPLRTPDAEAIAVGKTIGDDLWRDVAASAAAALDPPSDLHGSSAYRKHLAEVLTLRALQSAAAR